MEKLVEKAGLTDLQPPEARCIKTACISAVGFARSQTWPELNAVRELATEIKAAKKGWHRNMLAPF